MTTRNKEKTREKIINGAIALLTRSGFKDFGINSVAREAGCDKVLLYRYFGDIEGLLKAVAESVKFFPDPNRFLKTCLPKTDTRSEADRMAAVLHAYAKELRERPLTAQMILWSGIVKNPLVEACDVARKDFEAVLIEEGEPLEDERDAARLRLFSIFINGLVSESVSEDLDDHEEWGPVFKQMGESLWPSLATRPEIDDDGDEYGRDWDEEPVRDDDFPFSLL